MSGFVAELSFDIGTNEKHHIDFRYDQFWGGLSIRVDGQKFVSDLRIFSLSLVKTYELVVGYEEKHEVRFEKTRALLFAGFRPQVVRAYVDGQFVAQAQSFGPTLVNPA